MARDAWRYLRQDWRDLLPAGGCVVLMQRPQIALACPYCDSPIGQEVRANLFNDEFLRNVILTLLPIAVLLAVVVAIHFGLPPVGRAGDAHPPDSLDSDS